MKRDKAKPLKEKQPKAQYNMAQNTSYMIAAAWETRKSVLWYCLLVVFCAAILSVMSFFLNRKAGEWHHKHRDEESKYDRAFYYVDYQRKEPDYQEAIILVF